MLAALIALVAWPTVSAATPVDAPVAHVAATCDDYANQAEAQRAKDTRDPDGDGIYCVIYSGERCVVRVVGENHTACQQRVISTPGPRCVNGHRSQP